MRSHLILPVLSGLAAAAPRPQGFEFDIVDALSIVPVSTVDPLATPTVVPVDSDAVVDAVKSALQTNINDPTPLTSDGKRRRRRSTSDPPCVLVPDVTDGIRPDTPEDFRASSSFSEGSTSPAVVGGYTKIYGGQTFVSLVTNYVGTQYYQTYNYSGCALECDLASGCVAFNIAFQRTPKHIPVSPATSNGNCVNDESVTRVVCNLLGNPASLDTPRDNGVVTNGFQVAYAGSTLYQRNTPPTPNGYKVLSFGNAAINAPKDCNGDDTYLGSKIYPGVGFDPALCQTACESLSAYNLRHPPATGQAKTCQYFNTYVLLKNGESTGQYCAMYTESWNETYAKNVGQYRGTDKYTVLYSFGYSNIANPGYPKQACNAKLDGCFTIASARSSLFLNYNANGVIQSSDNPIWKLSTDASGSTTLMLGGKYLSHTGNNDPAAYLPVTDLAVGNNKWILKLEDPFNHPKTYYIQNKVALYQNQPLVVDVWGESQSPGATVSPYFFKTYQTIDQRATDNQHWIFNQVTCPSSSPA